MKQDERDYLAVELAELLKRYQDNCGTDEPEADDAYACYLLFSTLGGMILKEQGIIKFKLYVRDIEERSR